MPILDVTVIAEPNSHSHKGVARLLADSAGTIFGTPSGHTWVRLHQIPKSDYAENGTPAESTPSPVFVEVQKARPDTESLRKTESKQLCHAFSDILERPVEHIHIIYLPPASGRIAFGGELMTE